MSSNGQARYQTRVRHLEQYDLNFVRQRRFFFFTCVLRGFIMGLQYGVLIPSAWAYLKIFNCPTWCYGLLLASSKISGTCASLLLGRVYDKTKRLRRIIVAVNIIDIVGSLIYALPFSIWLLFTGRILSGIGYGFASATNSEIAWITQDSQRSAVYARVLIGTLCGIALGPPLAAVFQHVDLQVGHWHVDYRNFPGLISAFLWLMMLPVSMYLVTDLAKHYIDVEGNSSETEVLASQQEESLTEGECDASSYYEMSQKYVAKDNEKVNNVDRNDEEASPIKLVVKEITSPELLVLFITNAFAFIYHFSGETSIPLFTQEDFGWKVIYTSATYVAIAAECILVYSAVGIIGSKVSDSCLIICGLLFAISSSTVFLSYHYTREILRYSVPIFCVSVALVAPFMPLYETGGRSLLSKIIPMHAQGIIQGAYDSIGNISGILGPSVGAFGYDHVLLTTSILLVVMLICLVWFLCSLRRLKLRIHLYKS